jgi:hypothetical protein
MLVHQVQVKAKLTATAAIGAVAAVEAAIDVIEVAVDPNAGPKAETDQDVP